LQHDLENSKEKQFLDYHEYVAVDTDNNINLKTDLNKILNGCICSKLIIMDYEKDINFKKLLEKNTARN